MKIMYAAIERKHRVVWGIGESKSQAYQDAKAQWNNKDDSIKSEGFPVIEYHTFRKNADLTGDGVDLYQYVNFSEEKGQQDFDF